MEVERLRRALAELSDTLVALQRQIEQATQLLATVFLPLSSPTASPTSQSVRRHSPPGSSVVPELEQRVEELETEKRELTDSLERILGHHESYQNEINNAVREKEGMMKRYRLLVRVAADLLQRVMEEFPPGEGYDDEISSAVTEDLRRSLRSPTLSTSSSSGTARPRARGTGWSLDTPVHSPDISEPRGDSAQGTNFTIAYHSDLAPTPALGQDGNLLIWQIHTGCKIPASVKNIAGPFGEQDFVRLGIEKEELADLFQALIHPNDATIRLGVAPSPRGLGDVKLVFLYDPFYLESGTKTYILDWVTPRANREIINWLKNSGRGDEPPIFHTFTFSKRKNRWYYFGGMRWSSVRLDIWPTLGNEVRVRFKTDGGEGTTDDSGHGQSRASILKQLSNRSHAAVEAEGIEEQMVSGQLQEVCMEIASAGEMGVMEEIAARLGQSPREVKARRPVVVRGEDLSA